MSSIPMRIGGVVIIALALAAPFTANANSALRGIMHDWRRDQRATAPMLSGRAAFNEAAIRATLTAYSRDANRISSALTTPSADARDFKRRFVNFGTDAQNALQSMGQPAALKAAFSRIDHDCQSCHDLYKD